MRSGIQFWLVRKMVMDSGSGSLVHNAAGKQLLSVESVEDQLAVLRSERAISFMGWMRSA